MSPAEQQPPHENGTSSPKGHLSRVASMASDLFRRGSGSVADVSVHSARLHRGVTEDVYDVDGLRTDSRQSVITPGGTFIDNSVRSKISEAGRREASVHAVVPEDEEAANWPEVAPELHGKISGLGIPTQEPVVPPVVSATAAADADGVVLCNPGGVRHALALYFSKWSGGVDKSLVCPPLIQLFWSWLGAFLGILLVAGISSITVQHLDFPMIIGSFGASAVLLYGTPESKLAQPRNCFGGHVVSAVIGICIRLALGKVLWLSSALAMSLALLAMQITGTTHPPGGATALIVASAEVLPPWKGFQFLLTVVLGSLCLLGVALLLNNVASKRRYPTFWF